MKLSKTAFWDVNMKSLNAEENADFIIRKVFDFGLFVDVLEVMKYYPESQIVSSLISAPYLNKKTHSFASTYYNLKPEEFRCWSKLQSGTFP